MQDRFSGVVRLGLTLVGLVLFGLGGYTIVTGAGLETAVGLMLIGLGLAVLLLAAVGELPEEWSGARASVKWRKRAVRRAVEHVRADAHFEQPPAQIQAAAQVVNPPTLGGAQVPAPTVHQRSFEGGIRPQGSLKSRHIRAADRGYATDSASVERTPEEYEQLAVRAKTPEQFARLIVEAVEAELDRLGREQPSEGGKEPQDRAETARLIREGLARAVDPHDPPALPE